MYGFLIAFAALAVFHYGAKAFARTDPRKRAQRLKLMAAGALFAGAAASMAGGRWGLAVALSLAAAIVGGREAVRLLSEPPDAQAAGARTEARSAGLSMWLDHRTGAMGGTVLSGRFVGRALDSLSEADALSLVEEFRNDRDSLNLIEAYLDRRAPGWREAGERHRTAGGRAGPMTEQDAYQVLGLAPGADEEAVRRAHRSLMKRLHPDQGGSSYLAARVNEARDLLLGGRAR